MRSGAVCRGAGINRCLPRSPHKRLNASYQPLLVVGGYFLGTTGNLAKISQIYETSVDTAEPSHDVDFGDLKVHQLETQLRNLFDAI